MRIKVSGIRLLPPAPTGLTATAGDKQVELTWDDQGDSTIAKYQYSTNGGETFNHMNGSGAATDAYTVTGLTNGAQYTLALRAASGGSHGAASTVSATPLSPVYVSNTGESSDNVTGPSQRAHAQAFTTGGNTQGYPLANIEIAVHTAPGSGTLTVTVRDTDSSGNPGNIVHTLTNPATVGTGLREFTAPANASLNGNTKYWVYTAYSGGGTKPRWRATTSDGEDSGAYPGWSIADERLYKNSLTSGSWSPNSKSIKVRVNAPDPTPPDPSAPTGLAATAGDKQVELSWDDPGDSTITKYQYSTDGGETFSHMNGSDAATVTYTVTGLTNGTQYTLALRAASGGSHGAASTVSVTMIPAAPTTLSATAGYHHVVLTWDDPGNDTITEYQYSTDGGETFDEISGSNAATTTYTVTGLAIDTQYTLALRAVNASGNGMASTVSTTVPRLGTLLVGNTGQTASSSVVIGSDDVVGSDHHAQAFTTGGELLGYDLGSIELDLGRASGGGTLTVTVRGANSSGKPRNSVLYTLTNPTTVGTGPQKFTAPAGAHLNANTKYFVHAAYSTGYIGPNITPLWRTTNSTGEDSLAYPGWSIANSRHFRFQGNWHSTYYPLKINVNAPPAPVYVSNAGQTTGNALADLGTYGYAQAFTTGSTPLGYHLGSIDLDLERAPGSGTMTVTVMSSSPFEPGYTVYTLTNPAAVGTGVQKFTAPTGARLNANTHYFVYVSYSGGGTAPRLRSTTSDDEDPGAYAGWSIRDFSSFYVSGYTFVSQHPLKISLNGLIVAPPAPSAPTNLSATPNDRTVRLNWDYPGDPTIFRYQYSIDGGAHFTVIDSSYQDTTLWDVTGLINGYEYTFAVRGVSASGYGAASNVIATPERVYLSNSAQTTSSAPADLGTV